MKKCINKTRKYLSNNYEVPVAVVLFTLILVTKLEFYKAIILMLEFIVIMEVLKMISDFIKKEKLRLRFVIDIFIIFLIRDVIILASDKDKDFVSIIFLLCIIFVFFIFRILAIKFSPGIVKISKDTIIEYEDERKPKTISEDDIKAKIE